MTLTLAPMQKNIHLTNNVRFADESTTSVPSFTTVLHDPEQFHHEEDVKRSEEEFT